MLADYLNSTGSVYSRKLYLSYADKAKDDILNIVNQLGGPKAKIDYLSKYAQKNSREFFAECFANLESGKKNIYGEAMRIYLEKGGLL